jgi:hypothetical protein
VGYRYWLLAIGYWLLAVIARWLQLAGQIKTLRFFRTWSLQVLQNKDRWAPISQQPVADSQ